MKKLFLIRHAKSTKELNIQDIDRPLNQRGYDDLKLIGNFLIKKSIKADMFISSPAVRTYTTAIILGRLINYDIENIVLKSDLYESDIDEYINVISRTENKVNSLILSGHNPTISEILAFLTKESYKDMPTSGLACLQFSINSWENILQERAKLEFYITPQQLKE